MGSRILRMVDDIDVNIGLTEEKRTEVVRALAPFLATTYILYLKTLFYHWNVTGPKFRSLHKLFEEQYQDLHKAGDRIAERIRALGHMSPGTTKDFVQLSAVTEDDNLPDSADAMVENLLKDNETASVEARKALRKADEMGDEVTVDMLIARMAQHEEYAWMLRATLEGNNGLKAIDYGSR